MKVLIDMNLSTEWVELRRNTGHEAVHWPSVGQADAGDDELLQWARDSGAVIPTNDLDFGIVLVTQGLDRPSVIQLRSEDLRPSARGDAVLEAISVHATQLQDGVLVTIDPARARFRLLELGEDQR
jgi:predicted nuclease of predicted toxin-antitoxin system